MRREFSIAYGATEAARAEITRRWGVKMAYTSFIIMEEVAELGLRASKAGINPDDLMEALILILQTLRAARREEVEGGKL